MHSRDGLQCGLGMAILASIFIFGCSKRPKSYAPEVDPATAGKDAITLYDADGDGKISGGELDKAASLRSNIAKIDTNDDKALTAEEISARIRYLQTSKSRIRTPIHCNVYHDKQPLADAEVKLVPEKFLGDKMKTVRGKTNSNGVAILFVENSEPDDPPGVGPGFYRVEITKAGEDIPSKYNTDTILGLDTSMDNPVIYKGVRIDLEYSKKSKK
jgi:hypothetical protein